MTNRYLLVISAWLMAGQLYSQEVAETVGSRSIEMRPTEKRSLTLKPSERNPYARRQIQEGEKEDEVQNSEEIAIRKRLRSLRVTGASRSPYGLRLLMGDIQIERSKMLPQLIPNQTQNLKVTDVTMNKITLGWIDTETGQLTGKTMSIPYDLAPTVRYVLQGQIGDGGQGGVMKSPEMGVLRPKTEHVAPGKYIVNQ